MMRYVFDIKGHCMYQGDYVRCETDRYQMRRGDVRRIRRIDDNGNIVLRNDLSPIGETAYHPEFFKRITRHNPEHRKENTMLHIAISIKEGQDFEALAAAVDRRNPDIHTMAATSQTILKERIRARLFTHPDERWLILSGNTIGERAEPPVRFRSV